MKKIEITGGSKKLGKFEILIDNFVCESGIYHLEGANGSGKTTFLRIVAGIESLDKGRYFSNFKKIGYVPQNYRGSLMPWLSAQKNARLIDDQAKTVDRLIDIGFSKEDILKKPYQLSGGQCQRIAIARDVSPITDLILLDEPFSGLDVQTVPKVGKLLSDYVNEGGVIILTSHTSLPKIMLEKKVRPIEVIRTSDMLAEVRVAQ